jgi:hypothetical protein
MLKSNISVAIIICGVVNPDPARSETFCICRSPIRLFRRKNCTIYAILQKKSSLTMHNLFLNSLEKLSKSRRISLCPLVQIVFFIHSLGPEPEM